MSKEEEEGLVIAVPELPTLYPTLDNLVGQSKEFANDFISNLNNNEIYKVFDILPDNSYLINGPPGTSKTFTIQALNNTINDRTNKLIYDPKSTKIELMPLDFDCIFFNYDIGKFGTAYINRGSKIIQNFFNQIYQYSKVKPCCIILDEADALLNNRISGASHNEDNKVLETLMKNLQKAHDMNNVYTIMMTNLKEKIDPAILRAGRLDRQYLFELPNYDERNHLIQSIIDHKEKKIGYKFIRKYDVNELSSLTDNMSHADIYSIFEKAIKFKCKDLINKDTDIIYGVYITDKDIKKAIKFHKSEFKYNNEKRKIGFI